MDERYRQDAAAGRADVAITAASDVNQVTTAADEGAAAADIGGTGEADATAGLAPIGAPAPPPQARSPALRLL